MYTFKAGVGKLRPARSILLLARSQRPLKCKPWCNMEVKSSLEQAALENARSFTACFQSYKRVQTICSDKNSLQVLAQGGVLLLNLLDLDPLVDQPGSLLNPFTIHLLAVTADPQVPPINSDNNLVR